MNRYKPDFPVQAFMGDVRTLSASSHYSSRLEPTNKVEGGRELWSTKIQLGALDRQPGGLNREDGLPPYFSLEDVSNPL